MSVINPAPSIHRATDWIADTCLLPAGKRLVQVVERRCPEKIKEQIGKRFYGLLSIATIYRVSQFVERLTESWASRTPLSVPGVHYFDQAIIAITQDLHTHLKRVNELLVVPINLKTFIRRFSYDTVLDQLVNITPSHAVWINRLLYRVKHILLSILERLIRVIDFVLKTCIPVIKFGPLGYVKKVIVDSRKNLYSHAAEIAIKSIEKREAKLLKYIAVDTAHTVTPIAVKEGLKLSVQYLLRSVMYRLVREGLVSYFHVDERLVDSAIRIINIADTWFNTVKPSLDPYYATFDPEFAPNRLSFRAFCKEAGVGKFLYPAVAFVRSFFRNPELSAM